VLGGGISAYGWVTILLNCLWLNEHTHFSNTSFMNSMFECIISQREDYMVMTH
jgi:hypothetical protein